MASNASSNGTRILIHTANAPKSSPVAQDLHRRTRIKTRLSFQERLLRNSCLACAVLLGILALGSLNLPWAQKASEHVRQALTMEIDLDKSLGQLSFVQKLMPESALVFFNLSGDSELQCPVQGELSHPYSEEQAWLVFDCSPGAAVCAPAEGTVAAVSRLGDDSWGVMIDHGSGMESILAGLEEIAVQTGDSLLRGAAIGSASSGLFFELRQDGEPIDPKEKLGL